MVYRVEKSYVDKLVARDPAAKLNGYHDIYFKMGVL